jgi:hypothetical protein
MNLIEAIEIKNMRGLYLSIKGEIGNPILRQRNLPTIDKIMQLLPVLFKRMELQEQRILYLESAIRRGNAKLEE